MSQYEVLEVAAITVDPGHNVRRFRPTDAEGLFELGDSLEAHGQVMPVLINRTPDGVLHLIAGERRLRAAKEADLETIEAKVYDDLDAAAILELHLIENLQRKSLNVIEEAAGMQRLCDVGKSDKQIAALYGYTAETVRRRLDLLSLPDEVQTMITRDTHALPVHQALLLVGLSVSDALQIARRAAPSVGPVAGEQQVRQWVEAIKKGPTLPVPPAWEKRPAASGQRPAASDQTSEAGGQRSEDRDQTSEDRGQAMDDRRPTTDIGRLTPVAGAIGITGTIARMGVDDFIGVRNAVITVRAGDAVEVVKVDVQILSAADETLGAALLKALTAAQPAPPAKKKTAKKKTVKKS